MKRVLVFVILNLLILSLFVSAEKIENYNDVQYLEMSLYISSDIDIEYTTGSPVIDFMKSDVSFFPRNDERQVVKNLKTFSTPTASVQQGTQEIKYSWSGDQGNKLSYGYDATIKVDNIVSRVEEKYKFPLTKLDATVLSYTQPSEFIDLNTKIERKAEEIIGTEDDLYIAVFKVAEWTNQNINYNLTTLTAEAVQPSSWVLENREGVCDEMTNLFISFLRSVGVPARFVSGMVYSNLDYDWGPHGWAEVYFPEYGWIPFDVTFGEYGWINPSHIKLKDDLDSGSPTARYSWKASGINVEVGSLDIKTDAGNVGGDEPGAVEIEIIPVKNTAKFGSYVPIEVKLKNIKSSYIVPKIIVTKAPELTEKNVKKIILRPKEEKSLYWIIKIPEADESYIYTTTFEAKSMYGEISSNTIKYGNDFEFYSEQFANAIVSNYEERADKEALDEIAVDCDTDKKLYYAGDEAKISCNLENLASNTLQFDGCFLDDCQQISLAPGEESVLEKVLEVTDSIRMPIIIESEEKMKYHYISLNVIPIPEITISDPDPDEVEYGDDVEISFEVRSNTDVTDLIIKFEFGEKSYDVFKMDEIKTISVHTQGKQLLGDLKFEVRYKDKLDVEYIEQKALRIKVNNVPWYGRFLNWVANIF